MEYRERTSALFSYLTHENASLKEEVNELKKVLGREQERQVISDLQRCNSRLREQILTMEAEMLICRQIYEQEEMERLQLIEEYSQRERKSRQRQLELEERLLMLQRGVQRKDQEVVVPPQEPTLNLSGDLQALLRALTTLQTKYEEEKRKRKQLSAMMILQTHGEEDSIGKEESEPSDNQQVASSEQTLATINPKKPAPLLMPKLHMERAREVQRLIVQRIEAKQNKKQESMAGYKKQLEELREKFMQVCIANLTSGKRIQSLNRYVQQLQERNHRIIKLKSDQVPMEAYELSRR